MPPPNLNYTEAMTATIASRRHDLADNVMKNNALFSWLREHKNNEDRIDGGSPILEELQYAENPNFSFYSGPDLLPVAQAPIMSAAEFGLKLCSVQVIITGEEKLQNSGREKMISLMDKRVKNAETTMANRMSELAYGDGTAYGGKAIVGLQAMIPPDATMGVYGNIDRATNPFWRPTVSNPGVVITSANIVQYMQGVWVQQARGTQKPDLIIADSYMFSAYFGACQAQQRFVDAKRAKLGFEGLDFNGATVICDGGVGGFATAKTMYFLNTEYVHYRPHKDREFDPITPGTRSPVNQDAEVVITGWAGALTCSNQRLQGRLTSQ